MQSPSNFSYLDKLIAGCAKPFSLENLDFLWKEDIRHIITLTHEPLLSLKYDKKKRFSSLHLPIGSIPDENQVCSFIKYIEDVIEKQEKAVIHCQFGQERTGIFLAIYLIRFKGYAIAEAIELVKKSRPHSLQSIATVHYLLNELPQCVFSD